MGFYVVQHASPRLFIPNNQRYFSVISLRPCHTSFVRTIVSGCHAVCRRQGHESTNCSKTLSLRSIGALAYIMTIKQVGQNLLFSRQLSLRERRKRDPDSCAVQLPSTVPEADYKVLTQSRVLLHIEVSQPLLVSVVVQKSTHRTSRCESPLFDGPGGRSIFHVRDWYVALCACRTHSCRTRISIVDDMFYAPGFLSF